ncbi:hypothetical protein V1524DRAFT_83280 [Lipomyces starkeyi]
MQTEIRRRSPRDAMNQQVRPPLISCRYSCVITENRDSPSERKANARRRGLAAYGAQALLYRPAQRKGKMKASTDAANYSFDKGVYMVRVTRGWASLYVHTEALPPLSKRGKHAKWTSALDDEDVREQCLSYFRSLSKRTACNKA